jgi:ribonuclease H / adenosylcobalamin/alpha-ribazole phosphatase
MNAEGRNAGPARRPRKAGGTRTDAERRRLARSHRMRDPDGGNEDGMPVVWCDGGSRGNPGPAAVAFVLESGGKRLVEGAARIGVATAAEAEYRAVCAGLTAALDQALPLIEVRTDSRLLVAQMRGDAPVRSTRIAPLAEEARRLGGLFRRVRYRWVPESENGRAHGLVDEVLRLRG